MTSCLLHKVMRTFQRESTHKGKNLLLEEQILYFKTGLPLRKEAIMKELLPMKVLSSVDSSTVICLMSPFVIFGGDLWLFCGFYSIFFLENPVSKQCRP